MLYRNRTNRIHHQSCSSPRNKFPFQILDVREEGGKLSVKEVMEALRFQEQVEVAVTNSVWEPVEPGKAVVPLLV